MGRFANLVSKLTGDSPAQASRAGHDFRDDSGVRKDKDAEHFKSAPSGVESRTPSGISFFPEGKMPPDSSGKTK